MNLVFGYLLRTYTLLTVLYPYGFRRDFSYEMQSVFEEKLVAQMAAGKWGLWRAFWKEVRDWPGAVLTEYWFALRETFGRGLISLIAEDKSWKIENRRDAILACLPPVLFGICIALGALIIWEPWYTIPRWRLMTGFAMMMFPGLIIALGGLWALIKRLPAWGYTWAGGAVMGAVVFVKTMAEERADFGLPLLSPVLDIALAILLLLGLCALIIVTAWRGWRQAGLTSLGFATLAGMSSFSMATAAPLNRYDLALLAAPVGLLMSLLTYLYVRGGDVGRIIAVLGYGVMNAVVFLVIVNTLKFPPGHPSPVIPFLVVLTGALLVGPVAGLIGRPVRRVIQGS